jgi:hypothetical protein
MNLEFKFIIEELGKFINENVSEFEFIVDFNNLELWEFDFSDLSFNINECCNIFVRELEDNNIEEKFNDSIIKKVYKNNLILYFIC